MLFRSNYKLCVVQNNQLHVKLCTKSQILPYFYWFYVHIKLKETEQ